MPKKNEYTITVDVYKNDELVNRYDITRQPIEQETAVAIVEHIAKLVTLLRNC
jgi:hypothetical protein